MKRLKGARVAMPSANGSGEKMLGVLAKKYGLTLPGDIKSVYLGAEAPAYVAAFQRDLIDAALPFEPAGVLVQQAGKGKIYLNMMNGEIPEFRDILFMTLATHPDNLKDKPELLRKVAQVFTEATKILKTEPQARQGAPRQGISHHDAGDERAGLRDGEPDLAADRAHDRGSRRARRSRICSPRAPLPIDFPSTFTNEFLPK